MRFLLACLLALPALAEGVVTGTLAEGKLRLSWPKVEDADGYHVFLVEKDKETEVAKTGTPEAAIDGERFALYTVEVRWKKEGRWLVAARGDVGTFPPYFKHGTFTLDCFGRDTWRFDEDKNYDGHKGDLAIVSSQGGGSILKVRGIYGIAEGTPEGFGKIDPTKRSHLAGALAAGEVELRETQPGSLAFRCRSGEGGYVHVRAVKMESPRVTFQYVYVMRPEADDILRELAGAPKLAADEEKRLVALMDSLVADDTNARLSAEEAIVKAGPSAAETIGRQMKEHANPDVRDRLESVLRKIWERQPQTLR